MSEARTLDVTEAARLLGISAASAYRAVERGELRSVRIGRRIRVLRQPLERLLQGSDSEREASPPHAAA